jgi:hypothetical protein
MSRTPNNVEMCLGLGLPQFGSVVAVQRRELVDQLKFAEDRDRRGFDLGEALAARIRREVPSARYRA